MPTHDGPARPENRPQTKTPPVLVAVAWILVMLPLGWGVYESVVKSLPLFQMHGAPAVTSSP